MEQSMREFHLHTRVDGNLHQAVLVSLTRDKVNRTLELHEICIVQNNGLAESKTVINVNEMTNVMALHENGNILPEQMSVIRSVFYDLLTEESQSHMDLQEFMGDLQDLDETQRLLVANEAATAAHPIQTLEELINEQLQNNSRDE